MLIKEILSETKSAPVATGIRSTLPATWVLPEIQNQNPYQQYRMGLNLARARAQEAGLIDHQYDASAWGQNMVVVTPTPEEQKTLDLALKQRQSKTTKKQITTTRSQEVSDVNKQSPVNTKY